jgi:hypothetical protein
MRGVSLGANNKSMAIPDFQSVMLPLVKILGDGQERTMRQATGPEIDKEFGETAGQSFQTMLEHDAHELGLTLEEIRNWEQPVSARKARTTRKKNASEEYGE